MSSTARSCHSAAPRPGSSSGWASRVQALTSLAAVPAFCIFDVMYASGQDARPPRSASGAHRHARRRPRLDYRALADSRSALATLRPAGPHGCPVLPHMPRAAAAPALSLRCGPRDTSPLALRRPQRMSPWLTCAARARIIKTASLRWRGPIPGQAGECILRPPADDAWLTSAGVVYGVADAAPWSMPQREGSRRHRSPAVPARTRTLAGYLFGPGSRISLIHPGRPERSCGPSGRARRNGADRKARRFRWITDSAQRHNRGLPGRNDSRRHPPSRATAIAILPRRCAHPDAASS